MEDNKKFISIFGIPLRTLSLALLLAFIAIGLTLIAVRQVNPVKRQAKNTTGSTVQSAQTVLSVSQNPIVVSTPSGSFYETDILISTGQNKVNSVQLELSYDPNTLTNINIMPGPFFPESVVLLKNIDNPDGRISFALKLPANQSGISGNDIIATLSYSLANPKVATTTAITILPKTEVTTQDSLKSVLIKSNGATFVLNPLPSPTPAAFYFLPLSGSSTHSAR